LESGRIEPGATWYTYSGDRPIPATLKTLRFPLMTAPIRSPGLNPCARAKRSLTAASSSDPGAGRRPSFMYRESRSASPSRGSEIIIPRTGSRNPGTSRFPAATTRVSTRPIPGMPRICSARLSGARFRDANSSAKRWSR